MESTVLSVGEFIDLVNQTLEFAYPEVIIEGEVSSFKVSKGKFVFFDLKDDEATVNCFMMLFTLKTPLEDGMRIRIKATPQIKKWGRFSLTVRAVELAGEGTIKRAFELLKNKLEKEGLFAQERKRLLPQYPQRVGIVSSEQAAGYSDFIKIANTRWGGVEFVLADVQVQGESAPSQIVKAIEFLNQLPEPLDAIAVIRGGGSLEDLQAFNTEEVTRAVAGSRTPTVVGVGHETDITLATLAADVAASTPSNAAEVLLPDKKALEGQLLQYANMMYHKSNEVINNLHSSLKHAFELMQKGLGLKELNILINQSQTALQLGWERTIAGSRRQISSFERILGNLNPKQVLKRGYSITRHKGKVIKSAGIVKHNDEINVELSDGSVEAKVV